MPGDIRYYALDGGPTYNPVRALCSGTLSERRKHVPRQPKPDVQDLWAQKRRNLLLHPGIPDPCAISAEVTPTCALVMHSFAAPAHVI